MVKFELNVKRLIVFIAIILGIGYLFYNIGNDDSVDKKPKKEKVSNLVGRWKIENTMSGHKYYYDIYKENNVYGGFRSGSLDPDHLIKDGYYYRVANNRYGEYYHIDNNNKMTLYDNDGLLKYYRATYIGK